MADATDVNENDNDMVGTGSVSAAIWTNDDEKEFILLMEEEVIKGNRPKTTFLKPAWNHIREALNAKTRKNYDNTQLRNKFNQLRTRQKEFANLIKEKGINWNSKTGTLTATDEVHKSARRFCKKGCPLFNKLCLIYGDTVTGSSDLPSRSPPDIDNEEYALERNAVTSFDQHVDDELINALDALKRRVDLEKMKNSSPSMSQSAHKFLVRESMKALNALEGIDGTAYAKAVEKFHDDKLWMELFLEMPNNRKKDWVLNIK